MSVNTDYMAFGLDAFSLKGKVAVVTGANHGLGEAFAVALAKAGADLFIPHHSADVTRIREEIESLGRRVAFLQGDLTDADYRQACVDKCVETYGRIDILVNNAGRNFAAPLLDFPDDAWSQVVAIQMEAVHKFSRAVAPVMAKQGYGKIINIASALSFTADMNATAYTAAKHAVVGITRSFAAELGQFGIRVNAIAPGFFATSVTELVCAQDPTLYERVGKRIPLSADGEWGNAKDLMGSVVFLASPASDYVSGDVLVVDGGFKARMI